MPKGFKPRKKEAKDNHLFIKEATDYFLEQALAFAKEQYTIRGRGVVRGMIRAPHFDLMYIPMDSEFFPQPITGLCSNYDPLHQMVISITSPECMNWSGFSVYPKVQKYPFEL